MAVLLRDGVAILGLDVPNDDLRELVRFDDLLTAIGNLAPPGSAGHGPLDYEGYSYLQFEWTSNGNQWSSGQPDFMGEIFRSLLHQLTGAPRN